MLRRLSLGAMMRMAPLSEPFWPIFHFSATLMPTPAMCSAPRLGREDEDAALVEAFLADLPFFRDFDAEAGDVLALEAGNRQHGDLVARRAFELRELLLQRGRALARQQAGVVVDAAFKRRGIERERGRGENKKEK